MDVRRAQDAARFLCVHRRQGMASRDLASGGADLASGVKSIRVSARAAAIDPVGSPCCV